MSKSFQLVLAVLLFAAATGHAQISSPDKLVAPAPRNPVLPVPRVIADYQWLWQYAAPSSKQLLLADKRFPALLSDNLKAPQAFWSTPGSPLSDAARAFLGGEGTVVSTDNRHLVITGCIPDVDRDAPTAHCSQQRGLLFIDLGAREPLVVLAALRWNEEGKIPGQPGAPFTLWIFPSKPLDAERLPAAFKQSLAAWAAPRDCTPYQISSVILVEPDGIPHASGSIDVGVEPSPCTRNPGTHP